MLERPRIADEFGRLSKMPYSAGKVAANAVQERKPESVAKKPRARATVIVLLLVFTAIGGAVYGTHTIRWRAEVVALKFGGAVNDLSWRELFGMLGHRGGFGLERLLQGGSVHGAVTNPFGTESDLAAGAVLFRSHCATCHGADAGGESAPDLTTGVFRHGDGDLALFRAISLGIQDTAMQASGLTDEGIWQTVAFIRSLRKDFEPAMADREANAFKVIAVTDIMLGSAADEPANWLTYSGSYNSQRYSRLNQIDRTTVASLRLKWLYQFDSEKEPVEATPIVVGPTMYVTEPPNNLLALDSATGELRWAYRHQLPKKLSITVYRSNRGVAVYGDRVFMGTLDARLVAIDARTGKRAWEVELAKPGDGYSITGAPLAVDGKIIVGISGGDFGIRGFLDAYDAKTGARLWRFHTIPEPGEPGRDTWSGTSWRTGGGGTWLTGSFDPGLNLIYWGVGNPAPDFNGDARLGDNLYTNSVIALDADSGRLRWHFQFTPHDVRDWDSNQIPVLADLQIDGVRRKLMLWANRNGYYYVLDRETGKFINGRPFVKVTWAKSLTTQGRPVVEVAQLPTTTGTLTWPAVNGGTNWSSPSYSPSAGLFYVGAIEMPGIFFKGDGREWDKGEMFLGGASQQTAQSQTFIRALKPTTGELAWEYCFGRDSYGMVSGVLSTAGDVVFAGGGGSNDLFVALDATTGSQLWMTKLGGRIHAGPITFLNSGRQLVTIAAGRNLLTFEAEKPRVH